MKMRSSFFSSRIRFQVRDLDFAIHVLGFWEIFILMLMIPINENSLKTSSFPG